MSYDNYICVREKKVIDKEHNNNTEIDRIKNKTTKNISVNI